MFDTRLASFLSERQGLNHRSEQTNVEVLRNSGWARSVGGANIYLSLFSRNGSTAREAEADVKEDSFAEFATVRGCTYFLPKAHYQIGIKCGQGFNEASTFRTAQNKLGFTETDLKALNEAILKALEQGEADTNELKKRLGSVVKNFGELGKKVGQTTSLSIGLLSLQAQGMIRRIPVGGRLDAQNYLYCLFENAPAVDDSFTKEEAYRQLAELYWGWMGFASLAHFQWFSGLSKKVVTESVQTLNLQILDGTDLLATEETLNQFSSYKVPTNSCCRLISSLDSLILARRDLSLHMKQVDASNPLFTQDRGLQDLSHNAVVDRGRIIGVWEYDVETQEIVHACVEPLQDELQKEIESTQNLIRNELGDARSFSLDSPKSRKPSIEKIRSYTK